MPPRWNLRGLLLPLKALPTAFQKNPPDCLQIDLLFLTLFVTLFADAAGGALEDTWHSTVAPLHLLLLALSAWTMSVTTPSAMRTHAL